MQRRENGRRAKHRSRKNGVGREMRMDDKERRRRESFRLCATQTALVREEMLLAVALPKELVARCSSILTVVKCKCTTVPLKVQCVQSRDAARQTPLPSTDHHEE